MNIMYTTGMAWQLLRNPPLYTSLLPSILTSSFLPHWEDIWSPTRPALCSPPPLPPPSPPILSAPLSTCRDPLRHRARDSSDPPLAFCLSQRSLQTNNAHRVIFSSTGITISSIFRGWISPSSTQMFCLVSTQHVTAIEGLNSINNVQLIGHSAV